MLRQISILTVPLALLGCISTQEMPLAPNVVRLDTQASGLLFTGQTVPQTMRRAAQLTLEAGYTHFRLEQASSQQGSELATVITDARARGVGTGTAERYGNTVTLNTETSLTGSATTTPIYRRTSNVGVTVIMLKPGDPGIGNAFDAAEILKRYGA